MLMIESLIPVFIISTFVFLPVSSRYGGIIKANVSGYGLKAELLVDGRRTTPSTSKVM
jgi:hypothetical protein